MKHESAVRALMGESKAQQKQRLQERLEKLRKLKQGGVEVNAEEVAALEQVEAEGVDAVDAEVLNHLIEESVTETEEVTTNTLLNDLQVIENATNECEYMNIIYLNCGLKNVDVSDHRSYLSSYGN